MRSTVKREGSHNNMKHTNSSSDEGTREINNKKGVGGGRYMYKQVIKSLSSTLKFYCFEYNPQKRKSSETTKERQKNVFPGCQLAPSCCAQTLGALGHCCASVHARIAVCAHCTRVWTETFCSKIISNIHTPIVSLKDRDNLSVAPLQVMHFHSRPNVRYVLPPTPHL